MKLGAGNPDAGGFSRGSSSNWNRVPNGSSGAGGAMTGLSGGLPELMPLLLGKLLIKEINYFYYIMILSKCFKIYVKPFKFVNGEINHIATILTV